jgi:pimeloyl-[acyl-carrier protein] methyl ester esterase
MDGTGTLFSGLTALYSPTLVVRYPVDEALGYDALVPRVKLPDGPFVLVGESFSGPIAIRLAAARPPGLVALVLVATFVRSPVPAWITAFAGPWAFAVRPPAAAIRRLLAGPDADDAVVSSVQDAIAEVRPGVMACRARAIAAVDVGAALASVEVPVLCLNGRDDALIGPAVADAVAACSPRARRVVLDAPHLVLQRRPQYASNAIRGFLPVSPPPADPMGLIAAVAAMLDRLSSATMARYSSWLFREDAAIAGGDPLELGGTLGRLRQLVDDAYEPISPDPSFQPPDRGSVEALWAAFTSAVAHGQIEVRGWVPRDTSTHVLALVGVPGEPLRRWRLGTTGPHLE